MLRVSLSLRTARARMCNGTEFRRYPGCSGSLLEKNRSPFPPERPPSSHGGSESCDGSKLTLGGYDKSLFSAFA